MSEEITKILNEKIDQISQKTGLKREDLINEVNEVANDKHLADYPQDERLAYAVRIIHTRHISKEPTKEVSKFIPFGIRDKRKTANGWRAEIYALMREEGEANWSKKEIICEGVFSDMPASLQLFSLYENVRVEDRYYSYGVLPSTKFDATNAKPFEDELEFLQKYCKFPRLTTLRELLTHRTKIGEDGYPERMDMYIVSGITKRYRKGIRKKDNSPYGIYEIADESLGMEEEQVIIEGKELIIPTRITVWTPLRFIKWERESELSFLGNVLIHPDKKEPYVNAYCAFPSGIVKEIVSEEKK